MRKPFRREKVITILVLLTSLCMFMTIAALLMGGYIDKKGKEWNEFYNSENMLRDPTERVSFDDVLRRLVKIISYPQKEACELTEDVGGNWDFGFLDGVWTVCLDSLLARTQSKDCLVYSFGIGNDWSFDDAMHDAGCEVYSFDPTIDYPSYKRSDRHWFYKWGLTTDIPHVRREWTLQTFEEIRQRLGHENRYIDVVKMDVEGAEWKFLQSSEGAFKDIGQLTMEIHPLRHIRENQTISVNVASKRILLLDSVIERLGMKLFHVRRNPAALDVIAYLNDSQVADMSTDFSTTEILYELSFIAGK